MEPITRQEQLLDSIATGNSVELEPITREEQYLSAIAGLTDIIPEKPITRKEMFYEKILESGGAGGDGTAKPTQTKTIEVVENGTYKVTPDSGKVLSSVTAKVNVPERYEEGFAEGKDQGLSEGYSSGFGAGVNSVKLQEKTATENGVVLPDEGFSGMSKVTVAVPVSSGKEEQEKSITITQNGTTEVTPDEGKTLSKVTVETSVAGSGEIGKPYIDTSKITDFKYFCYTGSRIETLDKLDTSSGTIFAYMFYLCKNLTTVPQLDTSNGTNFENMFNGCSALTTVPQLDTSNGTTFENMFYNCSALTTMPQLDTSSGTIFTSMFYNCSKLESVGSFDTSKAEVLSNMFYQCRSLRVVPLIDTSKATYFANMYNGCSSLESAAITTSKSDMNTTTFKGCTALTNLTIGEGWAVSIYLTECTALTQESLHGIIENLADLTGKTAKTFSVGATNLAKIDEEHIAMLQAKNWNYS